MKWEWGFGFGGLGWGAQLCCEGGVRVGVRVGAVWGEGRGGKG